VSDLRQRKRSSTEGEPILEVLDFVVPTEWLRYFEYTGENLGCQHVGTKKVKGIIGGKNEIIVDSKFGQVSNKPQKPFDYADANGEEEIEDWNCHEDCPIKILDQQSGESKSSNTKRNRNTIGSFGMPNDNTPEYADKGGASRFFKQCNFEENDIVRFQYQAKASKSERNKGLEGFEEKLPNTNDFTNLPSARSNSINTSSGKERVVLPNKNFHPTVKPIKLMQYLVRLVTPPNGIVLDPFCGSGTTGVACKLEEFDFIGLEQDAEYCKIAQARIDNYVEEEELKIIEKIEGQLSLF
jgi:tRNA G10  N-methylase Trm11